ncbi:MAG: hypothetical protein ACLVJ6_00455 [Merdibacter sp.]
MQPFVREGPWSSATAIYGFRRLRRSLEKAGYVFVSDSDCELLLPLYRQLGTAMFAMLMRNLP